MTLKKKSVDVKKKSMNVERKLAFLYARLRYLPLLIFLLFSKVSNAGGIESFPCPLPCLPHLRSSPSLKIEMKPHMSMVSRLMVPKLMLKAQRCRDRMETKLYRLVKP